MRKISSIIFFYLWAVQSLAQNAPVILTQPADQAVPTGGSTTFSVSLSGQGPFSYQWRLNGTNLPVLIGTVAGNGINADSGDGGPATNASISNPVYPAVDRAGDIYISDGSTATIREVTTDGLILTVAGNGKPGFSGDGGAATNASLGGQAAVAADASGNLFIGDGYNSRVRKVSPDGIISTVAGNGIAAYSGDGGPATNASLSGLTALATDSSGNLFIGGNGRIRRVGTDGIIVTVAGNGGSAYSGDGGAATNAGFNCTSLALSPTGELFIADSVHARIRKVQTDGTIITAAGKGVWGSSGDGGLATNALLGGDSLGLAMDASGNLFISDPPHFRVREIGTNGIINEVAGSGFFGYSGDGGAPSKAKLNTPTGVAVDPVGNLFIADTRNNRIRVVGNPWPSRTLTNLEPSQAGNYDVVVTTPFGSVTSNPAVLTVLGPPEIIGEPTDQAALVGSNVTFSVSAMGYAPLSYQWYFGGMALAGMTNKDLEITNVSFADQGPYQVIVSNLYGAVNGGVGVLKAGYAPSIATQPVSQSARPSGHPTFTVEAAGTGPFHYQWRLNGTNLPNIITTIAGGGTNSPGDGGAATNAALSGPYAVTLDSLGNLFIADSGNNRIRKVTPDGTISTLAGNGSANDSGDGGDATLAGVSFPTDVAVNSARELFIAQGNRGAVRKVASNGVISIIAGNGTNHFSGDGGPATNALLSVTFGLALDASGDLLIVDGNTRLRRIDTNGIIETIAGTGIRLPNGATGDGLPALSAPLTDPRGVAVDSEGNIFVAIWGSSYGLIRKIGLDGIIRTVAGNGTNVYSGDGGLATNAGVATTGSVAVDGFGNLFIPEGNRVRRVGPDGIISTVAGNGTPKYSGDGGAATNASLNYPYGVALDTFGNLFIADTWNNRVREVFAQGPTLTLNNPGTNDLGNYDVVVTSPFGSIASSAVPLLFGGPPLRASIENGNTLRLEVTGTPGQTYILQAAGRLDFPIFWQPIYTNTADAGGNWMFTNPIASAPSTMFYRLTLPEFGP